MCHGELKVSTADNMKLPVTLFYSFIQMCYGSMRQCPSLQSLLFNHEKLTVVHIICFAEP